MQIELEAVCRIENVAAEIAALVGLAEVAHQGAVAADGLLAERVHLAQLAQRAGRGLGAVGGQHRLPEPVVTAAVQQQALGLQAVPPGPASLLLVVLEGLRHAGMDDVADVRAVDAHAEGDRGHDHVGPLGHVAPGATGSGCGRRARLQLLLGAGPLDPVADARLGSGGRLRGRSRPHRNGRTLAARARVRLTLDARRQPLPPGYLAAEDSGLRIASFGSTRLPFSRMASIASGMP